jgi:16S rRNA (cytidine1402-2'-O)-methyltransferase
MPNLTATGTLYVVATPIGNLSDIGARAAMILKQVAIVAAEDTRRSRVLLDEIGAAPKQLISLADHNETERTRRVLRWLEEGRDVALVSDAGTPLISDPGYELVRAAFETGIRVEPIPGPSAVMAALSVSPLPVERFFFEGFLPAKASKRRGRLEELAHLDVSLVCFEAARRIAATLADVAEVMGNERRVFLAKELTKIHERLAVGPAGALALEAREDPEFALGEYVVVIAPRDARSDALTEDGRRLIRTLCDELPRAQAARVAARALGVPKAVAYGYAEQLKDRGE